MDNLKNEKRGSLNGISVETPAVFNSAKITHRENKGSDLKMKMQSQRDFRNYSVKHQLS